MADTGRDIDLEIVSSSWRSISEADAFNDMLAAWDLKLEASRSEARIPLIDGVLKRQLSSIEDLLAYRTNVQIEDPIEAALAETPAPAMVLSPGGLVVALNEGASEHFGVKQGISAGTHWLFGESLEDFRTIRRNEAGGGNVDYAIVRTIRTNGEDALAEIYQLDAERGESTRPYTVVRSLELEWLPDVRRALSKAFGLTRAEIEVCRLLFANRELEAVARLRSTTIETVRSQVKRILNKTDVHSKVALMRLLAMLCARAGFRKKQADLTWSDPFGREELFVRRDGRKLAYSWIGAENGRPILFLAAQTTFYFLPQVTCDRLAKAGLKLICPSMPGYGRSDPPVATDQLADGTDALEELCEALGFGPIPAFASRGEQYYLILLAQLRPDLVSRLLCIGLPWRVSPSRERSLPLAYRTVLKLAQDAPVAFDVIFNLGFRMIKKWGPDFFITHGYGDTQIDRETIADPEIQPLLRSSVRHVVAQGPSAYKSEQEFAAKTQITERVRQLGVPLHWLIPAGVGQVSERDIDHVHRLNELLSAEIVLDAGELLAFQQPDLFVERLIEIATT